MANLEETMYILRANAARGWYDRVHCDALEILSGWIVESSADAGWEENFEWGRWHGGVPCAEIWVRLTTTCAKAWRTLSTVESH